MSQFQSLLSHFWPKYVWILPFLVISPMALLIPNDVFTQYPWASTYTDWLAQWIPMINRAAHLHPQPDKFRVFFAYAWSWLPLWLLLARCERGNQMRGTLAESLRVQPVASLLSIALFVWGIWLITYAPGEIFGGGAGAASPIVKTDMRFRMYYSDFSLFIFGPTQIYLGCLSFWFVTYAVRAIGAEVYAVKTPDQKG